MYLLMIIIGLVILGNAGTQAVRVIGGNVTVVQGGTAVFPCLLTESTESLEQISWQRKTRVIKENTNFYTILKLENGPQYVNGHDERFSFVGSLILQNGTLQLSNVSLSDEGTYTCIYSLFPSGNYRTEIPLNVLVPPITRVVDNFLTVGDKEVELASCTASSSWPPAKVNWLLRNLSESLRETTESTENADGTTTTVSTLYGVPTRDLNHRSVHCAITSPALPEVTTLPLTIQIYFSPSEVNIKERSKNSFECVSEANPKSNFTWSRSGQTWPESAVTVEGPVLQILRPSSELNGIFLCQAANAYGIKQSHLYLHIYDEGSCTVCWILFALLLIFNTAGAALWYYRSKEKCTLPCLRTRETAASPGSRRTAETPSRVESVPLNAGERESEAESLQ